MNDVIVNKIASIQRCIQRARAEYAADPDGLLTFGQRVLAFETRGTTEDERD